MFNAIEDYVKLLPPELIYILFAIAVGIWLKKLFKEISKLGF